MGAGYLLRWKMITAGMINMMIMVGHRIEISLMTNRGTRIILIIKKIWAIMNFKRVDLKSSEVV